VAGFSNGGFMAHRMGVQASDLVAAIAVVEGTLSVIETMNTRMVPNSTAPVSVLNLHGSAASVIPYCGVANSSFVSASQDHTFNYLGG
jgi:polyhydroxybutyrate depolymerase